MPDQARTVARHHELGAFELQLTCEEVDAADRIAR